MTFYLRNGNAFSVTDEKNIDIQTKLPAGNFLVKSTPVGELYLEQTDDFKPLAKYYGNAMARAERIMRTFHDRPNATGVMLTGEKGSGKTLLAKALSISGYETGMPTIVVNAPWTGDSFNTLLQKIEQPCIVLFDEFEKVYSSDKQEGVLTLLDGVFPSKKLFLLTCNDKWRVDKHMRNRPGRIFYMLDFKGLTRDFIIEYCEDTLENKSYITHICDVASLFEEFNFDMLKALVEDMNRYQESPQEVLELLNAKPEHDTARQTYDVSLMVNGKLVEGDKLYTKKVIMNAMSGADTNIGYYVRERDEDGEEDNNYYDVSFAKTDLKKIDSQAGKFMFQKEEDGDKFVLVLEREKPKSFNIYDLF